MSAPNPTADHLDALLTEWFDTPTPEHAAASRMLWFRPDAAFDERLRAGFAELAARARDDLPAFAEWERTPRGALGLMLLLDQLPRNLYRGRAEAFASDPAARAVAARALAAGHDRAVPPAARVFFYLPLEHSEDLADQDRSVALFAALLAEAQAAAAPELPFLRVAFDYAERHRVVIARFGRFPHRNPALGRDTTPEEAEHLAREGGF